MPPVTASSTKTNTRWLKPDQVESMRDAAYEGAHGQRDDAIITIVYDTGLRRNELHQVNRDMLDLNDGTLRIPPRIQKDYPNDNSPTVTTFELDRAGQLRTVRTLRSFLDLRDDGSPALFASRQSPRLSAKSINDVVKRAADRANVRPYTYEGRGEPNEISAHTLRHSVAWRMLRAEEGNTLYDVRNRLRHASLKTTEQNYDHFNVV